MSPTRFFPLAVLVLLAGAPVARADLMTTCAPEIGRLCGDVREGRGRVSACLASRLGDLGAGCRKAVQAVGRSPLTPAAVRSVFYQDAPAALPQVCVAPVAALCPGVSQTDGAAFACLYARSDRVPAACARAAQAALKPTK